MKNYYKLLGLDRNASKQEINVAFKKLSLQFHPDKNGGDSYYLELFQEINEAKQVLLDADKRAEYDSHLLKNFFSHDFLLRKHDRLQKKKQRNFLKKQHFFKKLSKSVKWGSAIAGLAGAFLLILIAIDAGIRFLARDKDPQAVLQLKELKKDPALTSTRDSKKKIENPVIVIPEAEKKTEPALREVSSNKTAGVIKREHVSEKSKSSKQKALQGEIKIIKKTETREVVKEPNKIKAITSPDKKVSDVLNKETLNTEKELLRKKLDITDMVQILKDVNSKKSGLNAKTNCAKIVVSSRTNVSNAFEIANFLKTKGFIISGREIIYENREGIKISTKGDCFVITVGSL